MHIVSISPSSLSQYDDCKMKYYIGNVLKIRDEAGPAAHKGTMVHLFFEVLASIKKGVQDNINIVNINGYKSIPAVIPSDSDIPALFDDIFTHFCNTQFDISQFKQECLDHVNAVLNTNEDPRYLDIVSTEHRFSVELPYQWAEYFVQDNEKTEKGFIKVNGIIDLVHRISDEEITIIDWKHLPLDTKIPTVDGWTTMGKIKVGDILFDMDGNQTVVKGKSRTKTKKCLKIKFDDNSEAICSEEHLWTLNDGTVKAASDLCIKDKIPVAKPLQLKDAELPIDPYLLGMWLGDGRDRACEITVRDNTSKLKSLNLLNNKHIPDIYLRASFKQRLELLQGLMDSDGNVNITRKQCAFTNCSSKLSNDVKKLLLSLGQRPYQYKKDNDTIFFRPLDINPFLLKRKANQIDPDWGYGNSSVRRIKSISRLRKKRKVCCIMVDSPTNTFLCTSNMIPTHNTGQRKDWITGKLKDEEYLKNDIQLKIYHAVLKILYPEISKINLCMILLRKNCLYTLICRIRPPKKLCSY
jgi:hypothetical protein